MLPSSILKPLVALKSKILFVKKEKTYFQDSDGTEAIMLLDIANFSSISHEYGNDYAEKILLDFFDRLKACIAMTEPFGGIKMYKHGVDVALITFKKQTKGFSKIVSRISDKMGFYFYVGNKNSQIPIQVAMGASWPAGDNTLKYAEQALTFSKKNKNGEVSWAGTAPVLQDNIKNFKYKKTADYVKLFYDAKDDGRIYPYYQPIYCLKTGEIKKAEALFRIEGYQGPIYEFISSLHKIGLGSDVFVEVFKHACMMSKYIDCSVNISPDNLASKKVSEMIEKWLKGECGNAKGVTFEILETAEEIEDGKISQFAAEMRSLGAKIAIDDFGSGYSNYMRILKEIGAHIVKIDSSIIKALEYSHEAIAILKGIVAMCKELNIETIAEHVHNEKIYRIIKECGVDMAQGYYMSEPLHPNELLALVSAQCEMQSA